MQEEVEEAEAKLSEAEHSASHGAVRAFFAQFCTPVFLEAVVLTFLGGAAPRSVQRWRAAQAYALMCRLRGSRDMQGRPDCRCRSEGMVAGRNVHKSSTSPLS